jgi:hypothetical protein
MELQLICHGMMLFWYRHKVDNDPTTDGYRILIPKQGMTKGSPLHQFRLGLGPGALEPYLCYADLTDWQATQEWKLEFGNIPSNKMRGPKPGDANLNFYRNPQSKAVPVKEVTAGNSPIAFIIDIPYPMAEDPIRATDYRADPYVKGDVVAGFGIHPRRIVSARVFTFLINGQSITLSRANETKTIVANPSQPRIKLHLYSQSADPPGNATHLGLLNDMLGLRKGVSNYSNSFDLKLNTASGAIHDPDLKIPEGLGFRDLLHLWEYFELFPFTKKPCLESAKVARDLSRLVDLYAYDPAECGQGSGCDYDPPDDPGPPPVAVQSAAPGKDPKPTAKTKKPKTKQKQTKKK